MFNINLHLVGLTDLFGLGARILHKLERLIEMSGTLGEQLAQFQAETSTALDAVSTQMTEIAADVDALLAGQGAGDVVTQAMVDAQTAIRDRVTAARDALQAINAKVPPTPTP